MMVKRSIYQEDVRIVNACVPNTIACNLKRQIFELKEWLLTSAMTEISIPHFQEQRDHPGMILIRNISIKLYFRWNELDIYRTFQLKLQNAYISKWEFL